MTHKCLLVTNSASGEHKVLFFFKCLCEITQVRTKKVSVGNAHYRNRPPQISNANEVTIRQKRRITTPNFKSKRCVEEKKVRKTHTF